MELKTPSLEIPSFLYGTSASVHRKAVREGRRCAGQYRKDGSLPAPLELQEVPPDGVVILKKVVDFQRAQPAWRLYMLSDAREGLYEALDWKDAAQLRDAFEASCREMAWGALYYAVSYVAPMDARCIALRLEAVLHFWDSLQSSRYLFTSPSALLSLDALMNAACDWVMRAWSPEGGASIRRRLETAAERMARATKEDSIEAVLRQLPYTLPFARGLKHPEVLANPALWRKRLATLDSESFARISAALPAHLLEQMYDWDKELGAQ